MTDITANELKTWGISAVESALNEDSEAIISVRGKPRYVVMPLEQYERLREAEIYSAWQEVRAAEARGEYRVETAAKHISRLRKISGTE